MSRIELDWVVGFSHSPEEEPSEWVPATVPGAVQLDWAKAHGWPEWWKAEEFRRYRWMEDVYWTYRAVLPEMPAIEPVRLIAEGVDYQCDVRLNGKLVFGHRGIDEPCDAALPGAKPGDTIALVFHPMPSLPKDGNARVPNTQTTKPGVFYGWDFAPRLVASGITRAAYVTLGQRITPRPRLSVTELPEMAFEVKLSGRSYRLGEWTWTIEAPNGHILREQTESTDFLEGAVIVSDPALWWPNGQGPQPLYTSRFTIDGHVQVERFGFRSLKLVPYEGMWDEPHASPGTRWDPPMTLEVNGRKIFAKGANWVPPSMFPGTDTRETYDALLRQCKDAGFNLVRVWGGGGVPKDEFFDLCDEYGILVWQEFPLACARYEGTPDYLRSLESEATCIVNRLKHHPSLAIWCGGNELFCPWSRMTDQDAALRLLNKVTYTWDPQRPFLPTSPIMGVGHGGYTFVDGGREAVRYFQDSRCTAYTEFGSAGPGSVEVIESFMPKDELWPPRRGTNWEWHHGFAAWDGNPESWLMLPTLEEYLGPFASLEELVAAGQLLQAEGMRHIYEEARRQKPRCSMALCWCLNEPWPTVANNSLISWLATPKPAFQAVKEACRPIVATARFEKMRWAAGETMTIEPCLLNDTQDALPPTPVELWIEGVRVAEWAHDGGEPGRNVFAPKVSVVVPDGLPRVFRLELRCVSNPEWSNAYRFIAL